MGEPVEYVPVDETEAIEALTGEFLASAADAQLILDQLRSLGYRICRAEP